jgi:phosphoribosylanthranilate isomerase
MTRMAGLKICGVTRTEDLAACVELGVDAVGINLWSGSRRGLSLLEADALLRSTARGDRAGRGVRRPDRRRGAAARTQALALDLVQIVGDDPLAPLPGARVGVGDPRDARRRSLPTRSLLPRRDPARRGGAGVRRRRADDRLGVGPRCVQEAAVAVAPVWLAGGITPENAADALAAVDPPASTSPADRRARSNPGAQQPRREGPRPHRRAARRGVNSRKGMRTVWQERWC